MKKSIWLIVGIIALLGIMLTSSYNNLVAMNENVNSKWSQVQVQLERRADLIPNLVSTVKGYATHERTIFTQVADARARLAGAQGVAETAAANAQLTGALGRLLAIAENYPNLKADANFRQLADELAGTENRVAVARKDYNDAAQQYNASIKRFPTVLIAGMFGFDPKDYFQAKAGAMEVPQVKF